MAFATIDKPSKYFNTVTYAGAGGTQSVSGLSFTPDLVWIKNRSITADHMLYDVVRGTGSSKALTSDNTDAEGLGTNVGLPSQYGYLSAFNSDGFTVVAGSSNGNFVNTSGNNFVSWNWDANGAGVSNTAGSISSTVSANTTAGFSIVKYTGTGSLATVGHGLGISPAMIIVKRYDGGAGGQWNVYHQALGNTKSIYLNSNAVADTTATRWNNTSPTSSVFTINTSGDINNSTSNHIAYCFAEVKGYSKFGSYTGNGSSSGNFIYTGFKPAFVLIKSTSSVDNWFLIDNKRDGYNKQFKLITPNTSGAEDTANSGVTDMDLLSNGFRLTTNWSGWNNSGQTNIYMAFSESPFVSSKGIPTTAR